MTQPWHPYNSLPARPTPLSLSHTDQHHLVLTDGTRLLDGIASWWTCIFGYNRPELVQAVQQQAASLSHVMFAGLSHPPAEALAQRLAALLPATPSVFFSDSGSVAVEVALKMARQYWQAMGRPDKKRFMALKNGYHGDTWGAMGVSDPDSLHQQFRDASEQTLFAPAPLYGFTSVDDQDDIIAIEALFKTHHQQLAAIILEPIWQGAGAMNFYRPAFLLAIRQLCDEYHVLLIVDEIATGFGKTGKLFAYQHAPIQPDIICLGKALTGGMMTLAATCTTTSISDAISRHPPYRFMHGPTYMANPLACAAANASLHLLDKIDWQSCVLQWQAEIHSALRPLALLQGVNSVRVLGHIGVIELETPALAAAVQPIALSLGIWLRPFGAWVYLTPAYTMPAKERTTLLSATVLAVTQACGQGLSAIPESI
jgi:adenosylmethionine-8-amino-7-oxononanoate aminotransferase